MVLRWHLTATSQLEAKLSKCLLTTKRLESSNILKMPTIQNPQEKLKRDNYRQRRMLAQRSTDFYKPGSAQTTEKTDVSRAREIQSINSDIQEIRNKNFVRTRLANYEAGRVRHSSNYLRLRPSLQETIKVFYKLKATDCENIIRLFVEAESAAPLSTSEAATLENVKKIRELQDIRHQDNVRQRELKNRLRLIKKEERLGK